MRAILSVQQLLHTCFANKMFWSPSLQVFDALQTFLKAVAGAISAPFKVLNRNIGHEEAFIRNPSRENLITDKRTMRKVILEHKYAALMHRRILLFFKHLLKQVP